MYEPSRQISSFYIAGFQYWDGALVLSELKVGERLRLVPEFDNPHDPSAMAIYRGKTKMGFVPGSENELLALMFFYGHSDGFELRVLQVSPDQKPWEQVRVGLYVTDARWMSAAEQTSACSIMYRQGSRRVPALPMGWGRGRGFCIRRQGGGDAP